MNYLRLVGRAVPSNQSPGFNQTNGTSLTHPVNLTLLDINPSACVFFIVFYSLVLVVGLLLNGLTLKVYFCRSQPQASSCVTIYLKNLAVADFLISLCLAIRITNFASSSVSIHMVYCNFGASAFYLNMYASILFMGYIAANRYLKIVHPLETHVLQTVRAAHIISVVTWVFLLATTTTYILVSLLTQGAPTSERISMSCDDLHSIPLKLLYKIVHIFSAAIFLLVLVSLVFFYYSTSRRLSLAQQKHPASPGNKKLAKSRRNMSVLVIVFCVCFVPYHLVRLPFAFWKWPSSALFYLKEAAVMVSVLNVCMDPLIYFIFCKAFRMQLNLGRMFSAAQLTTQAENTERRSSYEHTSAIKINRKTSLSLSMKQTGVL